MTRQSAEPASKMQSRDQASSELSPFELSRVYAKGWLAGMNCDAGISARTIHDKAEALNPYTVPMERARWMQGFAGAVRRKFGISAEANNP